MEQAQCAAMRIRTLALVKNPAECTAYILEVLRRFGVRWPLNPTPLRAAFMLRLVDWEIRLFGTRRLLKSAVNPDPKWLAPVLVLDAGGPMTARHDIHLAVLANSFPLRRYLRSGYLGGPSFRLAGHAAYRYALLGGAEQARRHASSALEWSEDLGNPIWSARTGHVVHGLIQPWIMRRRQALAPMDRVAEAAREIGD